MVISIWVIEDFLGMSSLDDLYLDLFVSAQH